MLPNFSSYGCLFKCELEAGIGEYSERNITTKYDRMNEPMAQFINTIIARLDEIDDSNKIGKDV